MDYSSLRRRKLNILLRTTVEIIGNLECVVISDVQQIKG